MAATAAKVQTQTQPQKQAPTVRKKIVQKKKAKKKRTKGKKGRKRNASYLHLIIDYLADGISFVERRVKKEKISPAIVRRARDELKKSHPEKADIFSAWCDKHFSTNTRGKSAPQAGETRDYKAQQVKDTPTFLRLTLDVLGIKKGERVRVEFDNDKYVVYKTPK